MMASVGERSGRNRNYVVAAGRGNECDGRSLPIDLQRRCD